MSPIKVDFHQADLTEAKIRILGRCNGSFVDANFTRAQLKGSLLMGTNFMLANFTQAKIMGNDFNNANFSSANFTSAVIGRGNKAADPVVHNACSGDLIYEETRFYKANFTGATFNKTVFQGVILGRAIISIQYKSWLEAQARESGDPIKALSSVVWYN